MEKMSESLSLIVRNSLKRLDMKKELFLLRAVIQALCTTDPGCTTSITSVAVQVNEWREGVAETLKHVKI